MAEDIFEAAHRLSLRRRPGFKAFAATIDLLGISAMALRPNQKPSRTPANAEGRTGMKAISLKLDDDVNAELEALCAAEGRG